MVRVPDGSRHDLHCGKSHGTGIYGRIGGRESPLADCHQFYQCRLRRTLHLLYSQSQYQQLPVCHGQYHRLCYISGLLAHLGNGGSGNLFLYPHEFHFLVLVGQAQRSGTDTEDKGKEADSGAEQYKSEDDVPEDVSLFGGWIHVGKNYIIDLWKVDFNLLLSSYQGHMLLLHGDKDITIFRKCTFSVPLSSLSMMI